MENIITTNFVYSSCYYYCVVFDVHNFLIKQFEPTMCTTRVGCILADVSDCEQK